MRERAKERKEVRETAHHQSLRGKTEREKGGGGGGGGEEEGIRSDSARGV